MHSIAQIKTFSPPGLPWVVSDLRDHCREDQKLIQRIWVRRIIRELQARGLEVKNLLCDPFGFGVGNDRRMLEYEEARKTDPALSFETFMETGRNVRQATDIDDRLHQMFFAVHDKESSEPVGGIILANLRTVSDDPRQVSLAGIIMPGVPRIAESTQIETWVKTLRGLMLAPLLMKDGRDLNITEWVAFAGHLLRDDRFSIELVEAFNEDPLFQVNGTLSDPEPVLISLNKS